MTVPVLAIRDDLTRYADWPAWRALRAAPSRVRMVREVTPCFTCNRIGWRFHVVLRRNPDYGRMAFEDKLRPGYLLPVICESCGGMRVTVRLVAVLAS